MNFDLHGLFKFRIEGTDKRLQKYFKRDYACFQTNDAIKSELDIIVGDYTPSDADCYIIDHKYYVKQNYMFWKDRHKIVRWSTLIENIETKPVVHFKGGLFSEIFLRENIIEPLIGLKLAQKGFSLLHASGIAFDNSGVVFPAGKGVGKTSTILNLSLEKGSLFLANEPIIISDDGMVYSFPSRIRLYHYNLKYIPQIYQRLTLKERLEFKLKHLIYVLSLKYGCLGLDINPRKIFKKIGNRHRLQSLVLLTRTNKDTINIKENINKEELIKRLVIINRNDMKYFSDCLEAYSYVCPNSAANSYWQTLENNLLGALATVSCHEIEIPFEYDSNVYGEIYKFLNRQLGSEVK